MTFIKIYFTDAHFKQGCSTGSEGQGRCSVRLSYELAGLGAQDPEVEGRGPWRAGWGGQVGKGTQPGQGGVGGASQQAAQTSLDWSRRETNRPGSGTSPCSVRTCDGPVPRPQYSPYSLPQQQVKETRPGPLSDTPLASMPGFERPVVQSPFGLKSLVVQRPGECGPAAQPGLQRYGPKLRSHPAPAA